MVSEHSIATIIVCALALAKLAVVAVDASACSVCIGFPEKTSADYLLESRCVVLARHQNENPFEYTPHEVLKGTVDDKIDLLVDSVSRRYLKADTSRHVLLVQDPMDGDWRNLGILQPEFEVIVRRILAMSSAWKGEQGVEDRLRFFLQLFGHKDRGIRELAYLELCRAPYPFVKQLGRYAERNDYAPMLNDPKYLEWRSLAILLIAQSGDPNDRRHILDSFHTAHRLRQTTNLAAWATAAIEIEGEASIDYIEANYFRSSQRTPEELQAVVKALSMQGNDGEIGLRDRIVSSYSVLLSHAPQFARQVADDLHAWKRTELIDELSMLPNDDGSFTQSDRQSIRRYLSTAKRPKENYPVHD